MAKPELYAKSTDAFWDNEHISKGMLAAHLNTENDSATRNIDFVKQSAAWITEKFPVQKYPDLLDLGCGPGIYAELFNNTGYNVTVVDFSKRSIEYAKQEAQKKNLNISYKYMDYLKMDFKECFDLVTLIWCDYEALSPQDRNTLLKNIYAALKPNGTLLLDIFSEKQYLDKHETKTFEYYPQGGFWSEEAHICLNTLYKYQQRIVVEQAIIITDEKINCFNIWEHYFTKDELSNEITTQSFEQTGVFANIAGENYSSESKTICIAARKVV